MKTQQQSPLRKSPRLSSSPSAQISARPKPTPKTRPSDAWALSLHVVEQVPLKICYPSDEEYKSIRRSSRFTTNKYKTPSPKSSRRPKRLTALVGSQLSRSPRSSSSSSLAKALTLTDGKNVGSGDAASKKRRRSSEDKEAGRRVGKKTKMGSNEILLRRSFRLRGGVNGNSAPQLLALPEPGSKSARKGVLSERRLRSRTVLMRVGNGKEKAEKSGFKKIGGETEYALIELPEKSAFSSDKCLNSETQLEKERLDEKGLMYLKIESALDELFGVCDEGDEEKCDSDVPSKKCLRSRKIQCKDETPEKTTGRIEGRRASSKSKRNAEDTVKSKEEEKSIVCCFVGDPIPEDVAQKRWQWRYELKSKKKGKSWKINADEEDEIVLNVDCHYAQAKVGNCVLDIGDCVYVKVLKDAASLHDKRRLFYSTVMNDNILDCIISKVNIIKVPPTLCLKSKSIQSAAFYYDMEYCVEYSTFRTLVTDISESPTESNSFLLNSKHPDDIPITVTPLAALPNLESSKPELALLDLYAGCGGMSTGLCLGAKLSSVNLVTVRNESADYFLELLRQWEKLCKLYVSDLDRTLRCEFEDPPEAEGNMTQLDKEESSGEYEVSSLIDICYGNPNKRGKCGLHFKGDADVICGGPPCQGISGYNRYRNFDSPLDDERNRQIIVFMDIVEFLKPRYVLMENVVDIIRFDKGSLGRYALSRLVRMKYQAKLGTIASGCYGLPQFRLRVFIWGANPSEKLPQFPLPTHDVVVRYWPPLEFERNIVAYDEGQPRPLEEAVVLRDSISDLPPLQNDENREEMAYEKPPETEFQNYIRLSKEEMMGLVSNSKFSVLYDHRPLKLSEHDYLRVCQIPHRKGANFRDLPGVIVGEDNVARRDPTNEPVMLPTGRPLVPDCVLSFEQGKSKKPYARVWWDETVSTVVTFPHVRVQALLHPEQDRLLTIRECARLQGFPDCYRFCGTIKERYCQIGNAVSIPVARALGYALGMAYRKTIGDEPLMTLPPKFSSQLPSNGEMVVLDS
ncbi:hypothetical protein DH2020_029018 [Rehmannia glutinosa]|uniref:Cytosine-specific methyltransferase n=1 Tax=Rehmannia glutinosa TaxID=99300 RepID=A0ABR0VQN2_REHGL